MSKSYANAYNKNRLGGRFICRLLIMLNDIDSLFKSGGTSALLSAVSGLDDFELICFLVVK